MIEYKSIRKCAENLLPLVMQIYSELRNFFQKFSYKIVEGEKASFEPEAETSVAPKKAKEIFAKKVYSNSNVEQDKS